MIRSRPKPVALRFGALLVLAACFIASALIRAGEVVAALPASEDDGFGNPIAQPQNAVSPADDPMTSKGPKVLLDEMRRQRERLADRTAELDAREKKLNILKKRMEQRLEDLRIARDRLQQTAALVSDAAGKDVERLAQMYQQMKPKQAAQIFDQMAPSFAAGFLSQMRPDAAALVMANMQADKAYAVSLMLAGRNMDKPGLEDLSQGGALPAKGQ